MAFICVYQRFAYPRMYIADESDLRHKDSAIHITISETQQAL